jgi:hypothetical protein
MINETNENIYVPTAGWILPGQEINLAPCKFNECDESKYIIGVGWIKPGEVIPPGPEDDIRYRPLYLDGIRSPE